MKYLIAVVVTCLMGVGCTSGPTSPTLVTPKPALRTIFYDINLPAIEVVQGLKARFPGGYEGPPLEAQRLFDYTAVYHGTPNVYFGEVSPTTEYGSTGIVVAPRRVADMSLFTSADWPVLEPGFTYTWHGNFVLTTIGNPAK